MRTALIVGISGQDGAYLARLLLDRDYIVWGASRDVENTRFVGLHYLGIFERVRLVSMSGNDVGSVLKALRLSMPDEVYNLSGQSSVGLSFSQPGETVDSIIGTTITLLDAIKESGRPIRVYNAGSGECFGDTTGFRAVERTAFRPRSPYAIAKAAAHWLIANYREGYGLFACTGILFNHESPLRPDRFVTQKIVAGACRISSGAQSRLTLGNLGIRRDWGWAPDYVEAMWRMLQAPEPKDYVIATGRSQSLAEFVELAFSAVGLNWTDHVDVDPSTFRPLDISESAADPSAAAEELGWKATKCLPEIVGSMVEARMRLQRGLG